MPRVWPRAGHVKAKPEPEAGYGNQGLDLTRDEASEDDGRVENIDFVVKEGAMA